VTDVDLRLGWRDALYNRYHLLRRGKKNWHLVRRGSAS
jgi:hypothetical protein